jgi:hypothetical protein
VILFSGNSEQRQQILYELLKTEGIHAGLGPTSTTIAVYQQRAEPWHRREENERRWFEQLVGRQTP